MKIPINANHHQSVLVRDLIRDQVAKLSIEHDIFIDYDEVVVNDSWYPRFKIGEHEFTSLEEVEKAIKNKAFL